MRIKAPYSRDLLKGGLILVIFVTFLSLLANKPAAWGNTPPAGKQAVVTVKGLSCPVCVRRLEKVLSALPGAQSAKVELTKGEAVIDFAPEAKIKDEQIQKTVRDAGFVPGNLRWHAADNEQGGKRRQ